MKLDYLFQRRSAPSRREPSVGDPGRSLVTLGRSRSTIAESAPVVEIDELYSAGTYWDPPAPRVGSDEESLSGRFSVPVDPTAMSPRQFSDWAHEMYICRKLSWDEYRVVGFPAELHPDYNRTVGVLTGNRAAPDRARDMIQEWEERLAFVRRHNEAEGAEVSRTSKVLSLLKAHL